MSTVIFAFERLTQFPPEIWAQITLYLPGEQLGRLKLTGSKLLWRNLCSIRSVKSVFLGRDMIRFLRWPSFMNELLSIEYINIKNFSSEWWQGWTFNIGCMPATLRKLKIRNLNVYGSSFFEKTVSASTVLPLLEHLDMNVLWQYQNSWSACFPQLTTLKVSSWRASVELPQTLVHLNVSGKIYHTLGEKIFIPPHLESLTADEIEDLGDLLPHLPATLREFRIDRAQCLHWDSTAHPLPTSLTSLGTLNFSRNQPSPSENIFHSFMFLTDISAHHFPVSCWKNLPKSLKIFRTRTAFLDPDSIKRVITSAENAHEHGFEVIPFHDLPKSITHLEVSFPSDAETLTFIDVYQAGSEMLMWPFELRTLILRDRVQMSVDAAKTLPATLTNLEVPHFYGRMCELLPTGLLTLFTRSCMMLSPEYLRMLPSSLTSLHLQPACINEMWIHPMTGFVVKVDAELANQSLIWPAEQCLPSNLMHLSLENFNMIEEAFPTIQRLPKLRGVHFVCSNDITDLVVPILSQGLTYLHLGNSPKITGKSFKYLPRSLSWLSCTTSEIDDSDIIHLPRGLISLALKSATSLTDECIRDLPRSLEYMDLGSCPGITSASFPDLPYHVRLSQDILLSKNDVPITFW